MMAFSLVASVVNNDENIQENDGRIRYSQAQLMYLQYLSLLVLANTGRKLRFGNYAELYELLSYAQTIENKCVKNHLLSLEGVLPFISGNCTYTIGHHSDLE